MKKPRICIGEIVVGTRVNSNVTVQTVILNAEYSLYGHWVYNKDRDDEIHEWDITHVWRRGKFRKI